MISRSLALALAFSFAAPLSAQSVAAHSDFTGTWVMDASKTAVSGAMPAPSGGGCVITQHGDSITIEMTQRSEQGEITTKRVLGVDGKEWKNSLTYQGTPMGLSSVLMWNGAVLNIQTNSDFQGTPVEQNETWTLSADATTFTQRMSTIVNGEEWAAVTLVFNKK